MHKVGDVVTTWVYSNMGNYKVPKKVLITDILETPFGTRYTFDNNPFFWSIDTVFIEDTPKVASFFD